MGWVKFTIHNLLTMSDKAVDNFEGLCGSCQTLVRCEPIQPLEDRLSDILSPILLREVLCVAFSQVSWQPRVGRTH